MRSKPYSDDPDIYDFQLDAQRARELKRKCWNTPDCGCPYCCPEDFEPEDE